jgi:hypothetical protein
MACFGGSSSEAGPVEVRYDMRAQFMKYYIEWCGKYVENDTSASSGWYAPLVKAMWLPNGCTDGIRRHVCYPNIDLPAHDLLRVMNHRVPIPFGAELWYGATPPSAVVDYMPIFRSPMNIGSVRRNSLRFSGRISTW